MSHRAVSRKLATVAAAGLALAAVIATSAGPVSASAGATSTYVVLYREGAGTGEAAALVGGAGGTLVANYADIGVVIARSASDGFAQAVRAGAGVEGVAATDRLSSRLRADDADDGQAAAAVMQASENLAGLQWDMTQIRAPQAHAINSGSPTVVVGDLDTGLDFTHPDLAPNYDADRSADCSSGAPQPLLPGNDKFGHGTHTAGTIAAAANTLGIVGVAPNVRIAGIKTSNDSGFFFPEMVVCAFVWAGTHGISVTNDSYFADPWLYNCKNDPGQRAIWKAERRAIRFAQQRGVLVVASTGNESEDLVHPTIDTISPDFPPDSEQQREVTNACAIVPVEVPGVLGVSATGNLRLKSFYSNYGMGVTAVAAPGGDSILQVTPEAVNGRVLSTWPADVAGNRKVFDCSVSPCAVYRYLQGTSMAAPHVVGVAALILSAHGSMSPDALATSLRRATNPLPCPDASVYAAFPRPDGISPQQCSGGPGQTSFYGSGEIDALKAVQ